MRQTHDDARDEARAATLAPDAAPRLQWLFTRWFLARRAMLLGVRAIVLDASDQVLLVRHTYVSGWNFPGGGVEIGQSAEEALARELEEEAGVTLTAPAQWHGLFFNPRVGRRDHIAVFVVRDFTWNGPPPPNREIAEARFWPLAALPPDLVAPARRRLAEVIDERPRDSLW
jgi:ADP-ribose pyrophosphatase YjhB (NUDIX family)